MKRAVRCELSDRVEIERMDAEPLEDLKKIKVGVAEERVAELADPAQVGIRV